MPSNKPSTAWILVIGIGEDGLAGLTQSSLALLQNAEIIIGGERHLKMLAAMGQPKNQTRTDWSKGFKKTLDFIEEKKGANIVVLASGDPMYFGVGATMARRFGGDALNVIPAVGAVSLAAALTLVSSP